MDIITVKERECFIDSEGLAYLSDNEHRAVRQLIRRHKDDLESFGVLTFKMSKPTKKGGRPKTTYYLNEQQATLLTTFMRNSENVRKFKRKLVKEFFRMRSYIQKQEVARLSGLETRKSLTDIIQQSGENERMHGHGYSNYTKLAYKLTGIEKGDRDKLSPDDLDRLESVESIIRGLVKAGKQYKDIKDSLLPIFKEIS